MRHVLTNLIGVIFALLLGAALYLYAATASVFDSYQPGMSDFLLRFSPNFIVLTVVGTPLAATFVPKFRAAASPVARSFAQIALATSATLFVGLMALDSLDPCTARRPANRDLRSTLEHSLRCPQLSNRSYFAPISAGVLSGFLLWVVNRRQGGAHKRAV